MLKILKTLFFIGILVNFYDVSMCLNVQFRENYEAHVETFNENIVKRQTTQLHDKASYTFDGFAKIESVPVYFPLDICVINIDGFKYANTLHKNKTGGICFAVYKMENDSYKLLADLPTPNAISMDCVSHGRKGYVALAYNITAAETRATAGSPIFEIAGERIRVVQYFGTPHLTAAYLQTTGNKLFLLQTFANTKAAAHLSCPYFRWTGSTFSKVAGIPCSNAKRLELFSMDYENYVAVANYADQRGRTTTYSEIYKYQTAQRRFELFQKIKTYGAMDVKYFGVPHNELRMQHFLIFANSKRIGRDGDDEELETNSVIYAFEHGQFVPYQQLPFYAVKQFLPMTNMDAEKFILLVACENQDIQIYNLNDWRFEKSDTQYTEGALGKGVAQMRLYKDNDNSYLIIANVLMVDTETNIFQPIFKQETHANTLRQQIIDWCNAQVERLMAIDVDALQKEVEAKLAKQQQMRGRMVVTDIPSANIGKVYTKSLIYPRLRLSSKYWQALSYANQALDVLEEALAAPRQKRESDADPADTTVLSHMNVETLVVHDKIQAQTVNGVNVSKPQFRSITAQKVIVLSSYKAPEPAAPLPILTAIIDDISDILNVEQLQITGKLNGYYLHELINNTLKQEGEQFLKAPIVIERLNASTVVVANDVMNGQQLSKLIAIDGGSYVVDQDIQFAAPIIAENVIINERLNNIHVHRGKFDLLLKRSNETQVVEGAKRFDNIKVLETINLGGQVAGEHLRSMSPGKAIHENLQLNGDYTIAGDVNIIKLLSAENIIDAQSGLGVKETLQQALRMDQPTLKNVNLRFLEAINANSSWITFVNQQDVQHLVRTNYADVQIIEGEKFFPNTLEIKDGHSEVNILNSINVTAMDERILLKHTNQTICVPMHFGKIVAKNIVAANITLGGKDLSDYLNRNSDQQLKGRLKVGKLEADNLHVEHLNTNGKILQHSIAAIYQHKAQSAPNVALLQQQQRKFNGTIYVKQLIMNSSINGVPVALLERQLAQLNGNIKYVGNYKFNNDMNITNLTFYGALNDIPTAHFGRCWLQQHGAQIFNVPQTFSMVNATQGILLREGKLNDYSLDDFYSKTYWIDREEHINAAIFDDPLQLQTALITGSVNALRIPEDMLLNSAKQPQVLYNGSLVQEHLIVTGEILNVSSLNGMDLLKLEQFLAGYGDDTLRVEHAQFAYAPNFLTLNRHNLKETLDAVWLANENVDLQHHVEIAEGYFEGLLEFEGFLNNINLQYLKENYFSLTRPQQIRTKLILSDINKFANDVHIQSMQLYGPIIEQNCLKEFNFNEFAAQTLKTDGPHQIHGAWHLEEAITQDSLQHVQVNDLNLVHDVLHKADAHQQPPVKITAPKRVKMANIQELYATRNSKVNDVPIAHWISDSVFVYENHTIYGVTRLDAINLYNDLSVAGRVNSIMFDEHTLMLRDSVQVVRGIVYVNNSFPDEQRILVANFEHLVTESVNGQNVSSFLAHLARLTPTPEQTLQVHGQLIFTKPLMVDELASKTHSHSVLSKRDADAAAGEVEGTDEWRVLELALTLQQWKNSYNINHYKLDYFEVRQKLRINATQLISLTLLEGNEFVDVIGVVADDDIHIYRWATQQQQFVFDQILSLPPYNKTVTDILKMTNDAANYLRVEKPEESITEKKLIGFPSIKDTDMDVLKDMLQLKKQQNYFTKGFEMQGEHCFAIYEGTDSAYMNVPIFCIRATLESEKRPTMNLSIYQKHAIGKAGVKQILSISAHSIALLYTDALEIWNASKNLALVQRIPLLHAKEMAVGVRNGNTYLALILEIQTNSLQRGFIEIYSTANIATTAFTHLQTLDIIEPQQLTFQHIMESNDLLLFIRTAAAQQPLLIYQHSGVAGFEKILGASTLPNAPLNMAMIELRTTKQYLVALLDEKEVTFVETVLMKF